MKRIPAILSIGFRPFFIGVALLAVINPIIWILNYGGHIEVGLQNVSLLFWHGHEMLFGFTGAMIAGFLLTASANWTNSKPYSGWALFLLVAFWFVERVSYLLPIDKIFLLILSNIFFPTLTVMLFLKLVRFPKHKYIFVPILCTLTVASVLHSWGYLFSEGPFELAGKNLAIGVIRFVVLLIAGRVIPFFTFKKIGTKVEVNPIINSVSLVSVALLVLPFNLINGGHYVQTLLFVVAAVSNSIRQAQWRPEKTIKIPILFILHIGIAFVNLSMLFSFIEVYYPLVGLFHSSLHLLMAAGVGTVGIGIMSRVSLGHTGRVIRADQWIQLSYILIVFGGAARVIVPLLFPGMLLNSFVMSALLWSGGFSLFLFRFLKILVTSRPDKAAN